MDTILAHAHTLVYALMQLMPSAYQQDSLRVMLGLFLEAQGAPLPAHSRAKSASALSRFLNQYDWSTRQVIRLVRAQLSQRLLAHHWRGRRPWLQVIIDLTSLEKRGKFKAYEGLMQVLNGKRGLQLVVLYLVIGRWRVPWNFRVWRGKGTTTPAQLAIRLLRSLPPALSRTFRVMVMADTAFGSIEFLNAVRQLGYSAIVGVREDRKLCDGRQLWDLHKRGQQVYLQGLPFAVSISWFYLERKGKLDKRYVLSTRPLKGSTITWWGRRRWQIEGFFKTIKHRFGLHCFGQSTLKGMYRWLLLALIAFVLAHWAYLSTASPALPDWRVAARLALETLFPQLVVCLLLLEIERTRTVAQAQGFDIQISRCKM